MRKSLLLLSLWGGIFAANAVQIEVGGGPQQEQFRGWIQYKGDRVDLKKDLHIKDQVKYFVYFDLRHKAKLGFIPLPDVRVEYLRMNSEGTGTVSKQFTFGALTVGVNDRVYTKFKFHQLDVNFHYTPLKSKYLKGSWGFGAKVIDFKATVRSQNTGQTETKSATIPLPFLYLKLAGEYWLFHLFGEAKGAGVDGKNYFYDWRVGGGVHYDLTENFRVSLDGGYRYQRYRVDDVDDVSADTRAKGGFGSLSLTFTF